MNYQLLLVLFKLLNFFFFEPLLNELKQNTKASIFSYCVPRILTSVMFASHYRHAQKVVIVSRLNIFLSFPFFLVLGLWSNQPRPI